MVSWKRWASWVTTPTVSWSESVVASRRSTPLTRTEPPVGVVEARDQGGDRRLARPARADERDEGARLDGEGDLPQHRPAPAAVTGGGRLEAAQGHLVGRRVREGEVVDLDADRTAGQRPGVGRLGDEGAQVEDLEDPLEGHERGHDVDPHVRDRGERAVERAEQRREGEERADGEGAADRHDAADPVDHRGGQCRDARQGDEEDRAVEGDPDADVAHLAGAHGVLGVLGGRPAEELDEQRTGHVEPLVHPGAHLGVHRHLLVGQGGEPAAHDPGGQDEEGHEDERAEGQGPGEREPSSRR